MMLNRSTLRTIATYTISKAAMVYNSKASVYSLPPPSRIQGSNYYSKHPKNLKVSRVRIAKSDRTGNVERRLGSGRPSKITAEIGETAFREALKPIVVHLSFSISPCSNVQNFSSHAHLNTELEIVP